MPAARAILDLALIEFGATQAAMRVRYSGAIHDPGNRRSFQVPRPMLRRTILLYAASRPNQRSGGAEIFAGQLSGKRHSKLSYCPMESHFAKRG